jgi:hypothetical protein
MFGKQLLLPDSFKKRAINLNGQKLRTITGWSPAVKEVNPEALRLQCQSFQLAQLW